MRSGIEVTAQPLLEPDKGSSHARDSRHAQAATGPLALPDYRVWLSDLHGTLAFCDRPSCALYEQTDIDWHCGWSAIGRSAEPAIAESAWHTGHPPYRAPPREAGCAPIRAAERSSSSGDR